MIRRIALLLVVATAGATTAGAAPPRPLLVKDIDAIGSGAGAARPTAVGQRVFFIGNDGRTGTELWRSDGTTAGTVQVADLTPGADGSSIEALTDVGGTLRFTTHDAGGTTLWRSDGTGAGTDRLAGPLPRTTALTDVQGRLFFVADDGITGPELWKSDGDGTARVADLRPGPAGSEPDGLVAVGGTIFFTADDGISGRELWRSDGSAAGPVRVTDLGIGPRDAFAAHLTPVDGRLFFTADDGTGPGLYVLDGDPVRLANGAAEALTAVGATLFFAIDGGVWTSDGTPARTGFVALAAASQPLIGSPVGAGHTFFFTADDGVTGRELWQSDGTAAGTHVTIDLAPGPASGSPHDLVAVGSTLFFTVDGATSGRQLWRTNGGVSTRVATLDPVPHADADSIAPAVAGAQLFFTVDDGRTGQELWTSDGTPAGTREVVDLFPGTRTANPTAMSVVDDALVFAASDGRTGMQLWRSDGTAAGTHRLSDASVGVPDGLSVGSANGYLLFPADDGSGPTLWFYDGAQAAPLLDFENAEVPNPAGFTPLPNGSGVVFTAGLGPLARRLWRSDGKADHTFALRSDLVVAGDDPHPFTQFGDKLEFAATDDGAGTEPWWTRGDGPESARIADIAPARPGSNPGHATVVNDTLFFAADGARGRELWRSDGRPDGTRLVADLVPGDDGSFPENLIGSGGRLYFAATNPLIGRELWHTDGTRTAPVADLNPGAGDAAPAELTVVDDTLFFVADDGTNGRQLWRTDGSRSGTIRLTAVPPQQPFDGGDPPRWLLTAVAGALFFVADDGVHGRELWTSDGTADSTRQVSDLRPGPPGANPSSLTDWHGTLYFAADDGLHGRELWGLTTTCGDGTRNRDEECDDGNDRNDDGCTVACRRTCRSASDCDDGDPCSVDTCHDGTCANAPLVGFAGAACAVDGLLALPACTGEPLPRRLRLAKRLARVHKLLGRAEHANRPRRVGALLRRADHVLRSIQRTARRLERRRRLPMGCADALELGITTQRASLEALRSHP